MWMIWSKTVQDEYSDRINITQADIDAEMARFAEGAQHYVKNAATYKDELR